MNTRLAHLSILFEFVAASTMATPKHFTNPGRPAAEDLSERLKVETSSAGQVFLLGETCAKLLGQVRSFPSNLKDAKAAELTSDQCTGTEDKDLRFKIDITPALSPWIRDAITKQSPVYGPNCYGAALAATNLFPFTGSVGAAEFAAWMKSPLCRELPAGEVARPGDVLSIRKDGVYMSHAATFLTEELIFEKTDNGPGNPFQILTRKKLFDRFKDSNQLIPERRHSSAPGKSNWYSVYRCQSLKEWVAAQKESETNDYLVKTHQSVGDLCSQIQPLLLGKKLSGKELNKMEYGIQASRTVIRNLLENVQEAGIRMTKEDFESGRKLPNWYLQLLEKRLTSIVEQLGIVTRQVE